MKRYELLHDTVKSKKGRVFVENNCGDFIPKDDLNWTAAGSSTWEDYSKEYANDTYWFKPLPEFKDVMGDKPVPQDEPKESLLSNTDLFNKLLSEALDRGIEYCSEHMSSKNTDVVAWFHKAYWILQAMKVKP